MNIFIGRCHLKLDFGFDNDVFGCDAKSKNKQTKKLLQSTVNNQQNEKTTYRVG